jgi:hypothetical protein
MLRQRVPFYLTQMAKLGGFLPLTDPARDMAIL